jgi:hypothetical protein
LRERLVSRGGSSRFLGVLDAVLLTELLEIRTDTVDLILANNVPFECHLDLGVGRDLFSLRDREFTDFGADVHLYVLFDILTLCKEGAGCLLLTLWSLGFRLLRGLLMLGLFLLWLLLLFLLGVRGWWLLGESFLVLRLLLATLGLRLMFMNRLLTLRMWFLLIMGLVLLLMLGRGNRG